MRRFGMLCVGVVTLLAPGVAHADSVYVSGEDGTITVRVQAENWCFGSPEYPDAFYCTSVDRTVSQRLP